MFQQRHRKFYGLSLPAVVLACGLGLRADLPGVKFAPKPSHAVLFVIDGLSYKAWDKVALPTLDGMIKSGTLVRQVFLPPAAHPHQGPYARLHTCSIPNPILMSGTIFIDERTVYFNQQFFPDLTAAFVANAIDYQTLTRSYHYVYQKEGPDEQSVGVALKYVEMGRPAFLSVHLQGVGEGGTDVLRDKTGAPWKNNIWHPQSPYRLDLVKADRLLGEFIQGLSRLGVLETTAIVVVGDHGQADTGWHPLELWDPSITTAVIWGAGIKTGAVIDYAELIDIGPTICALMGLAPPPTALGVALSEAFQGGAPPAAARPRLQETMNAQFRDFRSISAALADALEHSESFAKGLLYTRFDSIVRNFYGIERFIEWPRFKTIAELVEQNDKALRDLRALDLEVKPGGTKG
jgi:hypothetical protein